jgi:hypothetical protein
MQKDQFRVYMPKDPTVSMAAMYSGIAILVSYHLVLKGGPVLTPKNGSNLSNAETHSFVL